MKDKNSVKKVHQTYLPQMIIKVLKKLSKKRTSLLKISLLQKRTKLVQKRLNKKFQSITDSPQ
jgi:hypothetical protein